MKKLVSVLTVLGVATAIALPAYGGGRDVFRSDVVGSRPGVTLRTVPSGGVAWTVGDGSEVRLTEDGRLRADIKGLLITGTGSQSDGTTGPVTQVAASLTCADPASGDSGTPIIVSTSPSPLSAKGDARIDQKISLPPTCFGPIVLIRANSASGPWIAASGF